MEKLLYRPAEASEVLALGLTKIYELMNCGELRYIKVGTARRIPADALTEFVARLGAAA